MNTREHTPAQKTYIQWLQSLSAHLCDVHIISAALLASPDKLNEICRAIKQAMNDPKIAKAPLECSSVPGHKAVNYLQRVLPFAHNPELWIETGFNREQLHAIGKTFENSRESLTERLDAKRIRKDEALSANEFARRVSLHNAKKRIQ